MYLKSLVCAPGATGVLLGATGVSPVLRARATCGIGFLCVALGTVFATELAQGAEKMPPLEPLARDAQPWPNSLLVPAPLPPSLPPAVISREPWAADASRQKRLRPRPATDLPSPGWNSGLTLPAPWLTPSRPLARAASPDAALLQGPWRETGPDPDGADAASDPTRHQSQGLATSAKPDLRDRPAPFVRLTIPDPFEAIEALRFTRPASDDELPVAAYGLLPKP